jgi:hypothetical protein
MIIRVTGDKIPVFIEVFRKVIVVFDHDTEFDAGQEKFDLCIVHDVIPKLSIYLWHPVEESNLYPRLRRPTLYPLS